MNNKKQYTRSELRAIGHDCLAREWCDWDPTHDDYPTALEVVGVGILATLLRIADDISSLVATYRSTMEY